LFKQEENNLTKNTMYQEKKWIKRKRNPQMDDFASPEFTGSSEILFLNQDLITFVWTHIYLFWTSQYPVLQFALIHIQ